ncbi:MAG: hypothetical protein AMXMBFR57_15960 [Acidimicrobiia bacterium]
MEWLSAHVRAAHRRLRQDFRTLVAVGLLLGLGSAAIVTTTGMMWAVWGKPLPYGNPERLVRVSVVGQGVSGISPAEFADWRDRQTALADLASYEIRTAEVVTGSDVRVVSVASITPNLLRVLDVRPALGRGFAPSDVDNPTLPAVISHRLWATLGRDEAAVGRILQIRDAVNAWSVNVIGVLDADFELAFADPVDIYVPLSAGPADRSGPKRRLTSRAVVARLRPGGNAAAAQADLTRVVRQLERDYSDQPLGRSVRVESLHSALLGSARSTVTLYLVAGVGVLTIATINAAGLLLAAAVARSREWGIKIALGANARMLHREMAGGALVAALVVAPLGFLSAVVLLTAVIQLEPNSLPRLATDASPERLGLVSAVAGSGLALILVIVSHHLGLRFAGVQATYGVANVRGASTVSPLRKGLVALQIALGLPILVLGGLLSASANRMTHRPLGFEIDRLALAEVRMPSHLRAIDTYSSTIDALLAGVGAAGFDAGIAFEPPLARVPGRTRVSVIGGETVDVVHGIVTEGYWAALGIKADRGRVFQRNDRVDSPVAVVSKGFAIRYLSGTAPALGRQIQVGATTHTVVGIVPDVQDLSIRNDLRPAIYVPFDTQVWRPARFSIVASRSGRTADAVDDLRAAVLQVVPGVAVRSSLFSQRLAQDLDPVRFAAIALRAMATVSVILLIAGVVASISTLVAARYKECGIRLAIGASPTGVRWLVIMEILRPVGLGVVGGMLATTVGINLIQDLLFETKAFEVVTWARSLALLLLAVFAAAWTSTRGLRRANPSLLLREPGLSGR